MNRSVQGVVLLLLGGTLGRLGLSGTYLRYVKPSLLPWLLLTSALLVVLGAWALVDELRSQGDDSANHDAHAHGSPRIAWLLLLPVMAVFVIAPPALGAFAAERTPAVVTPPASAAPALPSGDPVVVALNDYAARAVWDAGQSLVNRNVEMTGFVTPSGTGWDLTRLTLTCCAADAIPTRIKPLGVTALPADAWVTVIGHWVPGGGLNSESAIPWIQVTSIVRIAAPKNPYE
ncbi:MAG: TIGR03943 family protein [Actinomycetes bacterium]